MKASLVSSFKATSQVLVMPSRTRSPPVEKPTRLFRPLVHGIISWNIADKIGPQLDPQVFLHGAGGIYFWDTRVAYYRRADFMVFHRPPNFDPHEFVQEIPLFLVEMVTPYNLKGEGRRRILQKIRSCFLQGNKPPCDFRFSSSLGTKVIWLIYLKLSTGRVYLNEDGTSKDEKLHGIKVLTSIDEIPESFDFSRPGQLAQGDQTLDHGLGWSVRVSDVFDLEHRNRNSEGELTCKE